MYLRAVAVNQRPRDPVETRQIKVCLVISIPALILIKTAHEIHDRQLIPRMTCKQQFKTANAPSFSKLPLRFNSQITLHKNLSSDVTYFSRRNDHRSQTNQRGTITAVETTTEGVSSSQAAGRCRTRSPCYRSPGQHRRHHRSRTWRSVQSHHCCRPFAPAPTARDAHTPTQHDIYTLYTHHIIAYICLLKLDRTQVNR